MKNQKEMWVEIEVKMTDFKIRTYRGQINEGDFRKLIDGVDMPFVKLSHCYWYNDPEEENDSVSNMGTFEVLGAGVYENFTGEIHFRPDRIIDIAFLKGGLESEPKLPSKRI